MNIDKSQKNIELLKMSYEHSTSWFGTHAAQRLTLINFYITLLGVSLGFVFTRGKSEYNIVVGIFILILTLVFKLLDRRVSFLIKKSEAALREIQSIIHEELKLEEVKIIDQIDSRKQTTFRNCFNILFFTGVSVSIFIVASNLNLPWRCVA